MVPHLRVQFVSPSGGSPGRHALPSDDEGAGRLHTLVSRESPLDVPGSLIQDLGAVVQPEVDLPLPITVVQVPQQRRNHPETGGHLPQVLILRRRGSNGHEAVSVNLKAGKVYPSVTSAVVLMDHIMFVYLKFISAT